MRLMIFVLGFCVSLTTAAQAATTVFTDFVSWHDANPFWSMDDFSSAPLYGPYASYRSTVGATLRRSVVSEDNGQVKMTSVDYDGDTLVTGSPYSYSSSSKQVYVYPSWTGSNYFLGPDDTYSRTNGWTQSSITRWPDYAQRRVRSDYNNRTVRSSSAVTGQFDNPVSGFGFLYGVSAGPWPGMLQLEVNSQKFIVPVLPVGGPDLFLGIHSTDPIRNFRLTAVRGPTVTSSETFTNRWCGSGVLPSPGTAEICLQSGSLQTTISQISTSLSGFFSAESYYSNVPSSLLATPEPSSALLMLAVLPVLGAIKRRRRAHALRNH